jgi:hypothetical protein
LREPPPSSLGAASSRCRLRAHIVSSPFLTLPFSAREIPCSAPQIPCSLDENSLFPNSGIRRGYY